MGGEVPTDIEATRQVIERHWAYTRQEDALEHALEQLERIPIEAIRMGNGIINGLSLLVKYDIGEVIILIHN